MTLRSAANYDRDQVSRAAGLDCSANGLPTLAQQQFRDECDINEIVRRFGLTGQVPENWATPVSGDFTGINDYHTALNALAESKEAFMQLPAALRTRFENDPGKLLAFLENDKNRDEGIKLGLIREPERDRMGELITAVGALKPPAPPAPAKT